MLSVIYAQCHKYALMQSVVMLSVVMLSVVMLSVIMLSVVMLRVVKLNVVAPSHLQKNSLRTVVVCCGLFFVVYLLIVME